jgi:hypothetical protein
MCTIGAINLDGFFIFKTRNPYGHGVDFVGKFDGKTKKIMVYNNDNYYGGMNEFGIAIVSNLVQTTNKKDELDELASNQFHIILPALDFKDIKDVVEFIKSTDKKMSTNMIIADKDSCFVIEASPEKVISYKVEDRILLVNNFNKLGFMPSATDEFDNPTWCRLRSERGSELIKKVKNLEDIKNILRDHENYPEYSICTHGKWTISSVFIMDTKNKELLYCKGHPCTSEFEVHKFTKK